jgi:hypothetical protein
MGRVGRSNGTTKESPHIRLEAESWLSSMRRSSSLSLLRLRVLESHADMAGDAVRPVSNHAPVDLQTHSPMYSTASTTHTNTHPPLYVSLLLAG